MPEPSETSFLSLLRDGVTVSRQKQIYVDSRWSAAGVTAQFSEGAETYHQRYFNRSEYLALMDRCFSIGELDRNRDLSVLDIGSGSGNSVLTGAELLPQAHIVASDISPQILTLLADFVESRADLRRRITTCCFDLHVPFFRPERFDVVVGSAILHHLIDPFAALKNVVASLKPGGKMFLIEPLEAGWLVMSALFEKTLTTLHELGETDGPIARLMRAMRLDIQARLGVPVLKPWTAHLDDKWVFDEPYLISLAQRLELSRVEIHPDLADLTSLYETSFRSLLTESGNADVEVPDAVFKIVRDFDRGISLELKDRLCPRGIIVFTK